MAYSGGGGSKLSAVDAILAEGADLVALEQIAKLNTAHLADDSALPSNLESRFRKLKSLPTTAAPAKTLARITTAPPLHHTDPADPPLHHTDPADPPLHHTDPADPPQPNPPTPAPAAPTVQEQRSEEADAAHKKENSPPQAHRTVATVPAVQEEDLEQLFGSGRARRTLRERSRGRDDSPSPPRQACCFGFSSPKKSMQRTPTRSKKSHAEGGGDLVDVLGVGDAGEWADENRRMVTELKEQQRKLKKALEEQVEVSRETAKMARWVKQASARMAHTAAIDDLLSDGDDDEDLK